MLKREAVYLWYYFSVQLEQLAGYWLVGILVGSAVSVFLKDKIHDAVRSMVKNGGGVGGILVSALLGAVSPLCMYGTIPIAASFSKSGVKDDWLAAFMMASVLLNPQLVIYSAALGNTVLVIRIASCLLCAVLAGFILHFVRRNRNFFNFEGFTEPENHDTDPNLFVRFLKNIGRNISATGLYFFLGIVLSALFQRYVPAELVTMLFGGNEAFGVLMAATLGVPLYACGGATIPLLQGWLLDGMSLGSAASFMLTGPATKITNLGALKIVLGMKNFIAYLIFVMGFSLVTGVFVNWVIV